MMVIMTIAQVIKALQDPEAYDEEVTNIEIVHTHISVVFLTDHFVYKVKKPVDFGFLDFTSLERRHFYCEEEVRRNRPLCDDMYLGVVTLNRECEGEYRINGAGPIIDYAVKMKRLPGERIMTRLLEEDKVTKAHIDVIAGLLADYHRKAATGKDVDEYGSLDQVRANWVQNFEQTRDHRGGLLDAAEFDDLERRVLDFMTGKEALFEKRVTEGRIRECHGDVHSGNIFILENDDIYIFDAIEFYRGFSCSDVANEVAFLAMDLDFMGREDLSDHFVDRYIEYSKDAELKDLLDFYRCYRAYVRAKVIGFKLFDRNVGDEEKEESRELVKRYFKQAKGYSLNL